MVGNLKHLPSHTDDVTEDPVVTGSRWCVRTAFISRASWSRGGRPRSNMEHVRDKQTRINPKMKGKREKGGGRRTEGGDFF